MDLKVAKAAERYKKVGKTRLHTPGHKGKVKSLSFSVKEDITELAYIDNEKVVLSAEEDLSALSGAKFCRILTDGASAGVAAAVYAVKNLGDKLIIMRSAHKSVYNALALANITPVIVDDRNARAAYHGIIDSVKSVLENEKGVIGALFTYPDYYGGVFDIASVYALLKSAGKVFIADGAHGGNLRYIAGVPYAGEYSDIWIEGNHKTFPTVNQGATVYCNDAKLVSALKEGTDIFATTSPCYPIIASVEYGVKYMEEKGKIRLVKKIIPACEDAAGKIEKAGFKVKLGADKTKLYLKERCEGEAIKINAFLEKKKVFAEMIDDKGLLFAFSVCSSPRDKNRLVSAIEKYAALNPFTGKLKEEAEQTIKGYFVADGYLKSLNGESEEVELRLSVGRIAAANAGIFPPCYPVVVAGERITDGAVKRMDGASCLFGVTAGKIKVVR